MHRDSTPEFLDRCESVLKFFRNLLLVSLSLLLQHDEKPDLLVEMSNVLACVVKKQELSVKLVLVLLLLVLPGDHLVLHRPRSGVYVVL